MACYIIGKRLPKTSGSWGVLVYFQEVGLQDMALSQNRMGTFLGLVTTPLWSFLKVFWDVHRGTGVLTHSHRSFSPLAAQLRPAARPLDAMEDDQENEHPVRNLVGGPLGKGLVWVWVASLVDLMIDMWILP